MTTTQTTRTPRTEDYTWEEALTSEQFSDVPRD